MKLFLQSKEWIDACTGGEHAALEEEERCWRPTRMYNNRELVGKRCELQRLRPSPLKCELEKNR